MSYNILKAHNKSIVTPEIINNSFYIKINVFTLSLFDSREAVLHWVNLGKDMIKLIQ